MYLTLLCLCMNIYKAMLISCLIYVMFTFVLFMAINVILIQLRGMIESLQKVGFRQPHRPQDKVTKPPVADP